MENHILTDDEKKALVGLLCNHLTFGTTLEMLGEMEIAGVKRLNVLRGIFSKLIKNFSLIENIDAESFLVLGLPEFITQEDLEKFAANEKNKHLQLRAQYFLSKKHE